MRGKTEHTAIAGAKEMAKKIADPWGEEGQGVLLRLGAKPIMTSQRHAVE